MKDHWRDYQNHWHLLTAPLRPNDEVVQMLVTAVGTRLARVLLLGVTPELVQAFQHLTAVDKSAEMIETLWHPGLATQTVRQANWLSMDDTFGKYTAIVGDGSLNVLQSDQEMGALLRVVNERLGDHGVFACRVFERPDVPIMEADLLDVIDIGTHGNFHAFKWMIAMSLAAQFGPTVRVTDIRTRFDQLFPDRRTLSNKTGWDLAVINTIDVYRGSATALSFPDRQEFDRLFAQHFDDHEWRQCGTYDLAERCPIVVAQRA